VISERNEELLWKHLEFSVEDYGKRGIRGGEGSK
jgi:hypothetical protein